MDVYSPEDNDQKLCSIALLFARFREMFNANSLDKDTAIKVADSDDSPEMPAWMKQVAEKNKDEDDCQ